MTTTSEPVAGGIVAGAGGLIKPDVVFFGGNLETSVRDAATAAVREASGMLLLGTSAQVFSAYVLLLVVVSVLPADAHVPHTHTRRCITLAHFEGTDCADWPSRSSISR